MPAVRSKAKVGTKFVGFEKYEHDKVRIFEQVVSALYEKDPDATLKEVAKRAQIGVSTLTNINSGKTLFPRVDTLWKMAAASGKKIRIE
jgi:hypothetical protein